MASIRKRTHQDGTTTYRVDVRLKGFPPQRATFKRLTDARKWGESTESAIRENRYSRLIPPQTGKIADNTLASISPSASDPGS